MRPDTTMKYMILLSDNADMREIFSSRSDLMEEMDGLLELAHEAIRLVRMLPGNDEITWPATDAGDPCPSSRPHRTLGRADPAWRAGPRPASRPPTARQVQ